MTSRRLALASLLLLAAACRARESGRPAPPLRNVSGELHATAAPSAPEWTHKPEPKPEPKPESPSVSTVETRSASEVYGAREPPMAAARPPQTPVFASPGSRPSHDTRARESALDSLPTGYFTVDVPRRMTVGQDVKARAQVSAMRQALIDRWRGAGIPEPEELKISEEMSVRLVCSPQAFEVTPKEERWQLVGGETTQWEWNVTPLKSGSYALSFIFSVRLPGRPPHDRESHDERIEVAVAPGPPPTPTPTPAPFYKTILSDVGSKLKENIALAIVGLFTAVGVALRKKLIALLKSRG